MLRDDPLPPSGASEGVKTAALQSPSRTSPSPPPLHPVHTMGYPGTTLPRCTVTPVLFRFYSEGRSRVGSVRSVLYFRMSLGHNTQTRTRGPTHWPVHGRFENRRNASWKLRARKFPAGVVAWRTNTSALKKMRERGEVLAPAWHNGFEGPKLDCAEQGRRAAGFAGLSGCRLLETCWWEPDAGWMFRLWEIFGGWFWEWELAHVRGGHSV